MADQRTIDGGIADDGWNDADGFIGGGLLVVLHWAGVVLAVAAFVIDGSLIVALGAIVAVVALFHRLGCGRHSIRALRLGRELSAGNRNGRWRPDH